MRCDPIQKKGMPSFFVLALFGVSPNVDSTCLLSPVCQTLNLNGTCEKWHSAIILASRVGSLTPLQAAAFSMCQKLAHPTAPVSHLACAQMV